MGISRDPSILPMPSRSRHTRTLRRGRATRAGTGPRIGGPTARDSAEREGVPVPGGMGYLRFRGVATTCGRIQGRIGALPRHTPTRWADSVRPGAMAADSVFDRVVKHLFESHAVAPGHRVVETRLAEDLGVSRIPIRECLGRLLGQGMVVGDPDGHGVRMRPYRSDDIRQLYELRELLEGGAARGAAVHARPTHVSALETACNRLEEHLGDVGSPEWGLVDHRFHSLLAEACGNERVAQSLQIVLTECHSVFYGPWLQPALSPSNAQRRSQARRLLDQHRRIVAAVKARDPLAAERMARRHMHGAVRHAISVTSNVVRGP